MKLFHSLNQKMIATVTVASALLVGGAVAMNASVSANSDWNNQENVGMPQITSDVYDYGVVDLHKGATVYLSADDMKDSKVVKVQSNQSQNVTYSSEAMAGGQEYYGLMGLNAQGKQAYFGYIKKSDATLNSIGKVHVNYNKHYGIQIWTNHLTPVKTSKGGNKKLAGQSNWNVYDITPFYRNGKEVGLYYNLGGNQYIDAHYVTFHHAAGFTQFSKWNPF